MTTAAKTVRTARPKQSDSGDSGYEAFFNAAQIAALRGELPKGFVRTFLRIAREEQSDVDARIRGSL